MSNRRVGKALSTARERRRKACPPHRPVAGTARGAIANLQVRSRRLCPPYDAGSQLLHLDAARANDVAPLRRLLRVVGRELIWRPGYDERALLQQRLAHLGG